jgi:hypothetical protein
VLPPTDCSIFVMIPLAGSNDFLSAAREPPIGLSAIVTPAAAVATATSAAAKHHQAILIRLMFLLDLSTLSTDLIDFLMSDADSPDNSLLWMEGVSGLASIAFRPRAG